MLNLGTNKKSHIQICLACNYYDPSMCIHVCMLSIDSRHLIKNIIMIVEHVYTCNREYIHVIEGEYPSSSITLRKVLELRRW